MNRVFVSLSALAAVGVSLALSAPAAAQAPAAGGAPAAAPLATRPTVAVFNIVEVIREFKLAKYHMYVLGKKRQEMSKELLEWRGEYIKKQDIAKKMVDPKLAEPLVKELTELSRKIEDKDREIQRVFNDEGSKAVGQVYDHIKSVVDRVAQVNGYHVVFAYPDFSSPEEKGTPQSKEMQLRPAAAQPFYVAPQVDITKMVVQYLNEWYKAPGEIPADALNPPAGGLVTPTGGQQK